MDNTEIKRVQLLRRADDYATKMLGRYVADCEYYLGHGKKAIKYLLAQDPAKHIEEMRKWRQQVCYSDVTTTYKDLDLFEDAMKTVPSVFYLGYDVRGQLWDHLPLDFVGEDESTDIAEHIHEHWFLELFTPVDSEDLDPFWIVWIGGNFITMLDYGFGKEIIDLQNSIINYTIGGKKK